MNIIVFSGPTISAAEGQQYLEAEFWPPVKQGDVYLASLHNPKAIIIIDGYFERVPAVWHKEILYAMSQGIHVYGCSSMGALRAAELEHFGMVGFGNIFKDFHQGILEDDDEVTLIHAPEEYHYQALSNAMVNIRATIKGASKENIISKADATTLVHMIKKVWYPKRNYALLLTYAKNILTTTNYQNLSHYIESNPIDLKKQDAIGLLSYLAENIDFNTIAPKTVNYSFSYTDAWYALAEDIESKFLRKKLNVDIDDLITELKLHGHFFELKESAITRRSALREAKRHNPDITPNIKQQTLIELASRKKCLQTNNIDFDKMGTWLDVQKITMKDFNSLVEKQTAIQWLENIDDNIEQEIIDLLKLNGSFDKYETNILLKKKGLQNKDLGIPTLQCTNLTEHELWSWFFRVFINKPIPEDIHAYACSCGFSGIEELKNEAIKQYLCSDI